MGLDRFRQQIPQNVPGVSDQFEPASSAHWTEGPLTLTERFMKSAPPSTVSNTARILNRADAWEPTSQLDGVLRCQLPVPQPCALSISTHFPTPVRFPVALRLPFVESYEDAEGQLEHRSACIFVEWGHGAYRDMLWLDFGPHTVQLPACSWVSVYAYAGRVNGLATGAAAADVSASIILGHDVTPDARYTQRLVDLGQGPAQLNGIVPPFARRLTLAGAGIAGAMGSFQALASYGSGLVYRYDFPLALGGAALTPQSASPVSIPVPAATFYTLNFTTPAVAPATQSMLATFEVAV